MHTLKRTLSLLTVLALLFSCPLSFALESYPLLQKGDAGEAVLALKQRMKDLGYFNAGGRLTNVYNDTLVERLMQLEQQNGLLPTGEATPELQALIFSDAVRSATDSPLITEQTRAFYSPAELPDDYPTLDADGFLSPDDAQGYYLYQSREEGLWLYVTPTLNIEIRQYTDAVTPLVWYESIVHMRGDEELQTLMDVNAAAKRITVKDPRVITKEYNTVFAVSDDFYGYRKSRGVSNLGVIVRSGQILAEKTKKAGSVGLPNFEIIALFENGRMQTFQSDAHTAQEYLDMGVTDTWAFGPILIQEGEINPVLETAKLYQNKEPRCAMGMVAPGHYVFLTVKGRLANSEGATPMWLALRLQALGCTEALNLDGGNSVALVFMDDMLNKPEDTTNRNYMKGVRALNSLIGVGSKPADWVGED